MAESSIWWWLLSRVIARFPYIGKWAMRKKWPYPKIILGPPRQRSEKTHDPKKPHISWWHIPVTIETFGWWQDPEVQRCTAHLFYKSIREDGPGVRMRWTVFGDDTERETSLTLRSSMYVPVALRDETGDGSAVITNETYFASGEEERSLVPGRYMISLAIKIGDRIIERADDYQLKVPVAGTSNGHFHLEKFPQNRDW